jgi:hypothetical protein
MTLICKHTTRAMAWLGPGKPGVVEAFKLAQDLEKLREELPYTPANILVRSPAAGDKLDQDSGKEHIDPDAPAWDNLFELFEREWWESVWCVQEFIVSSNSTGHCGNLEIRMEDLVAAAIYIFHKRGLLFGSDNKTLPF